MGYKFIKVFFIFLILLTGGKTVFAEKESPDFVVRDTSSLEKVFRNSFKEEWLKKGKDDEINIFSAKNESESFQVVIIPFKDLENLKWQVISEDVPIENIKIQPVGYVEILKNLYPASIKNYKEEEIRTGWWPDPLFSTWKKIDKIDAYQLQPIWITIDIPENIKAGSYKIKIIFFTDETNKANFIVNIKVWDFQLPERMSLKTSFWYGTSQLKTYYPEIQDTWEVEKKFLKMALDNRITPINCDIVSPYYKGSILEITYEPETGHYIFDFSKVKRYLDFVMERNKRKGNLINIVHHGFGHGLSFYGYIKEGDEIKESKYPNPTKNFKVMTKEYEDFLIQYFNAWGKFLKENNWYKYGYIGYIDEPGPNVWETSKWFYPISKKVLPEIPTVSAMNYMPSIDAMKECLDIMIPGFFSIFTPENLEKFREVQKEKELWGYVCYKTSCIDYQSIDHRIWTWICWKYNLKGFLYWGIVNWSQAGGPAKCKEMFVNNPNDRWPNKAKWQPTDIIRGVQGDGYLIYPSPEGEPWSSIRLENIRDGIEDYEYFCILKENIEKLKKIGGNEKIIKEAEGLLNIDDIILNPDEYIREFGKILERREKLGEMIEKTTKILKGKSE